MERPQDNQVIEISNLTTYQQTAHIETQQLFLKTTQGWFETTAATVTCMQRDLQQ
jgi:hypothetical protein